MPWLKAVPKTATAIALQDRFARMVEWSAFLGWLSDMMPCHSLVLHNWGFLCFCRKKLPATWNNWHTWRSLHLSSVVQLHKKKKKHEYHSFLNAVGTLLNINPYQCLCLLLSLQSNQCRPRRSQLVSKTTRCNYKMASLIIQYLELLEPEKIIRMHG